MAGKTRGKGEGSLYQQADGLWACAVELPGTIGPDGEPRRRRKVVRRKDKGALIKELRRLKLEVAEHGDIPTSTMTAGQWFTHWLEDIAPGNPRIRPSTLRGYRSVINGFVIPVVGRKRLEQLSPADVRAVHQRVLSTPRAHALRSLPPDELPEGTEMLSSTYALLAHNAMSAALKTATREGLVRRNVCTLVDRPAARVSDEAALEVEEAIQVLAHCATIPDGPLWATYLLTGARRGEVLGIERDRVGEDLDLSWQLQRIPNIADAAANFEHRPLAGSLYLARPKSSAGWRVLPLVDPLRSILALALQSAAPGTSLVFTDRGGPWDPDRASARWLEVVREAGVDRPEVTLHGARHTAADLLYLAGVPEDLIQDILGQSVLAVTRRYRTKSRAQRARLEGALRDVAAILAPGAGSG